MKLISAEISNFRLLKNLKLDFSCDKEKPLTVIRAANETGKTTCQTALIWCLYGSKALPKKGDYSLFPSDEKESERVEVTVEIEFEIEHVVGIGRGNHELRKSTYRLNRTCNESASKNGEARRAGETQNLWRVTPKGTERVLQSEVPAVIENALPESLKDVYFTDGDSAMSFIEAAASQGVKRKRVTNAIEALLGLNILEKTISHLGNVANKFSQEIDNKDYAKELEKLCDHMASYEEDIAEWTEELELAEEQISKIQKELATKDKAIEDALKLGDKEKLVKQKQAVQKNIQRMSDSEKSAYKSLRAVVSNEKMSRGVLAEHLENAKTILNGMNRSKQLPKVNVPILEELLDRDACFCGSDLRADSPDGSARRKNISEAIDASRESDLIQEAASSLFYRIRSIVTEDSSEQWTELYGRESSVLINAQRSLAGFETEAEDIEKTISEIDDSHLQKLKEQRDNLRSALERQRGTQATRNSQIDEARSRLREAEHDSDRVRKKLGKTNSSAGNWDVANAAKSVFLDVVDLLRKEELSKVSSEMNRIFLSMIGASSSNSDFSRIRRAELTDQFDIVVFGPNDRQLNPDQDLNGASRRAITLAFILALTKVSQVEAPNIIDTPLGMMSGYVKQSVLLRTIEEGTQVILFLTQDEIRGVEEIIDKHAGMVFTLTNPAHYPTMLAHKPQYEHTGVVRCECNHHMSCIVCERKGVEVK